MITEKKSDPPTEVKPDTEQIKERPSTTPKEVDPFRKETIGCRDEFLVIKKALTKMHQKQ